MMPAEQKLEILAKEIVLKTPCPKTAYAKAENSEKKRSRLTMLLLAVLCLSFAGAGSLVYYFSNGNPSFQTLQDNGYVSVINERQKKDGVTLTVEAAVTDGAKTYIRIRAKGLPKETPIQDQISHAYLMNQNGQRLQYENVPLYTGTDKKTEIWDVRPVLDADDLEKDEAVLLFYGAPSTKEEGVLNLYLSFDGVKGEFVVEEMTLKVPEITVQDTSSLDLVVKLPYGEGKIEQIIYTALETYFDVRWTLDSTSAEGLADYLEQYTGVYENGEKSAAYEPFHPSLQAVKDSVDASQYTLYDQFIVPAAFDPEKPLVIRAKDKKDGTTEELIRIP